MKHKRTLSITMVTIVLVSLCAVYASTSVSAATSVVGSPAVCSQPGTNTLDLFVRGTDNLLWWKHQAAGGAWSNWKSLGGNLTATPGAASATAGNIVVAVRGTDGALWYKSTTDGGSTWSGWKSPGGQLLDGTGPAAIPFSSTAVSFVVTGTDSALWYMTSSGWKKIGGAATSAPGGASFTIAQYGITVPFVAVRGTDAMGWYTFSQDGGSTWAAWNSTGGNIREGTGPAAVCPIPQVVNFTVTGTDNAVWWTGSSSWIGLGGNVTSSPAVASKTTYAIDLFAVGSDGGIWTRSSTNGGNSWGSWKLAA